MDDIQKDFLGLANNKALKALGIDVVCYSEIDSTNQAARRLAAHGARVPALIVADTQSAGRGRMGRSFYSPVGTGLYMTLLLDVTDDAPSSVVKMTSAAAVAAALSIRSATGVDCGIKWVNDIYLDGKKIAGILAESFFESGRRFVCVGVGVNVCTDSFPLPLEHIASSIGADSGKRAEIAVEFCRRFLKTYGEISRGDARFMEEYRELSIVLGKNVVFTENGVSHEGIASAIDDDGGLLINCEDGNVTLRSGEISLRLYERKEL